VLIYLYSADYGILNSILFFWKTVYQFRKLGGDSIWNVNVVGAMAMDEKMGNSCTAGMSFEK